MAFRIIAEKESETVRMQRSSSLLAVAKAKVWADEGWTVTVVAADEDISIVHDAPVPLLAAPQAIPELTFEP